MTEITIIPSQARTLEQLIKSLPSPTPAELLEFANALDVAVTAIEDGESEVSYIDLVIEEN